MKCEYCEKTFHDTIDGLTTMRFHYAVRHQSEVNEQVS
jgi:hypothetical protein